MPADPRHLTFLSKALESTHGICVTSNNPSLLRTKLYTARKDYPAFKNLSFIIPTNGNELWILNPDGVINDL